MNTFQVTAHVIPDPFDNTDAIISVKMTIVDSLGNTLNTTTLSGSAGNNYSATVTNIYSKGFRYFIAATNSQEITRILPTYIISKPNISSDVKSSFQNSVLFLSNHPNPSSSETTIEVIIPHSGFVELGLFDILGNEVKVLISEYLESGNHSFDLNVRNLPAGSYVVKLKTADGMSTQQLQIVK
jgi:hypothetical protein